MIMIERAAITIVSVCSVVMPATRVCFSVGVGEIVTEVIGLGDVVAS